MPQLSDNMILYGVIAVAIIVLIIVIYNTPTNRYIRKCRRNVYSKLDPFDFDVECDSWKEYKHFDFQQYVYDELRELDPAAVLDALYEAEESIWSDFKSFSDGRDEKLITKGRKVTQKSIDEVAVFKVICRCPPERDDQKEAVKSRSFLMRDILNYDETRDYAEMFKVEPAAVISTNDAANKDDKNSGENSERDDS